MGGDIWLCWRKSELAMVAVREGDGARPKKLREMSMKGGCSIMPGIMTIFRLEEDQDEKQKFEGKM